MTNHLSNEELVSALDDERAARADAHLGTCEDCRSRVAELRALVREVAAGEMPEPSPLFWDHFSARVRQATAGLEAGTSASWWRLWRPAVAMLVTAGLVIIVGFGIGRRVSAPGPDAGVSATGSTSSLAGGIGDDIPWEAVVDMAASLSSDDMHRVVQPDAESPLLVDELTPAERAAFVRLLRGSGSGAQ